MSLVNLLVNSLMVNIAWLTCFTDDDNDDLVPRPSLINVHISDIRPVTLTL